MKNNKTLSLLCACMLIAGLSTLESCKRKEPEKTEPPREKGTLFSGTVWSSKKEPIAEAAIDINGKEIKSGPKGEFELRVDSAARYIVTIRKTGYGIVSKVYIAAVEGKKYVLPQAFTVTVNASKPIQARDALAPARCAGTSLKDLNWGNEEYKKIPLVYNADGQLVDFGWTNSNLKDGFDYLSGTPVCNPGISLSIPANTIVDQNNNPVSGDVTLSLTTIDVFSDDGMPGDYTFRDQNGKESGFMISLGAATIEITSKDGQKYNLNPKAEKKAELTIPIEPAQQKFIKEFPATIPLMYYDEKAGTWYQEGEAKLDKKTKSYVAQVAHFSTINMDYKMPDPACIKFRQNSTPTAPLTPFQLATVTTSNGLKYATTQGNETPNTCLYSTSSQTNLHLLYAVPKDSEICIVMLDPQGTANPADDIPYGIRIHQTRNETYGATPPTACPHPECNATVPAPCYDATTMRCIDLDCTDVYSFSGGSCSYLPLTLFTQNVIGTARKSGAASANTKWIFKTPPANGASYAFTIQQLDGAGNPLGSPTTGNKTYNTASPIQAEPIPALDPGTAKITITANGDTSAQIELIP